MVHKGFNDYVNTVLETMVDINDDGIDEVLFNEILANTDTRVLLTGHSLGGAVATLLAERLVSMGIDKDRVPVITFGAPAIGNAAFAEVYGDKIDLRRITNNADPVPGSLQTFFGGYKQFGKHHKYNLSRKLSDFSMIWECILITACENIMQLWTKQRLPVYVKNYPCKNLKERNR